MHIQMLNLQKLYRKLVMLNFNFEFEFELEFDLHFYYKV
jgi:hypothetical protein